MNKYVNLFREIHDDLQTINTRNARQVAQLVEPFLKQTQISYQEFIKVRVEIKKALEPEIEARLIHNKKSVDIYNAVIKRLDTQYHNDRLIIKLNDTPKVDKTSVLYQILKMTDSHTTYFDAISALKNNAQTISIHIPASHAKNGKETQIELKFSGNGIDIAGLYDAINPSILKKIYTSSDKSNITNHIKQASLSNNYEQGITVKKETQTIVDYSYALKKIQDMLKVHSNQILQHSRESNHSTRGIFMTKGVAIIHHKIENLIKNNIANGKNFVSLEQLDEIKFSINKILGARAAANLLRVQDHNTVQLYKNVLKELTPQNDTPTLETPNKKH